jgi:beta-lactamase regulating signal transducer with metallopeptidase domain
VIRLLGDIFWFVPFYRFLSRRIDACRELIADQMAVRTGAEPVLLAAALVKLGEVIVSPPESALYSAFLKRKSLIAIRVRKLTESSISIPTQPHGWKFFALRAIAIAWVSGAVFSATLGGNYQIEQPSKSSNYVSDLVHRWLSSHLTP